MKQTWQNLIFLLHKTADLYDELLRISQNKKQVLVSGKADNLPPLVKEEEVLVVQAGKFETARQQIIAELAVHYGCTPEELNLTELEKAAQAVEMQDEVRKAGERLKTIVTELRKMNELNAELTQQALFFVNCSINLLMQNSADQTYQPNNSANQAGSAARSRLLIDRKV